MRPLMTSLGASWARRYEFMLRPATVAREGAYIVKQGADGPELDENHDPAVKILDEFGASKHPNP